jgi:hypothetical protein
MQKVVELNSEETKSVVGGVMAARAIMQQSPLERLIGIIIRDIEIAFGGGKQRLAAQK